MLPVCNYCFYFQDEFLHVVDFFVLESLADSTVEGEKKPTVGCVDREVGERGAVWGLTCGGIRYMRIIVR